MDKKIRTDSFSIDCKSCGQFNCNPYIDVYKDHIGEYIKCSDCGKKLYVKLKKNCYNCKHIENGDGGDYCHDSLYCNKIENNEEKMEDIDYLAKAKKCCELVAK